MEYSNWQVLVVEDERDSIRMVSDMLTHFGIQVSVANNGEECLASLHQSAPTLVVMDLSMPVMDGWETLAEMRADMRTAHIPVVAITAYHSASVAQDALAAGFDAYFPKPLDATSFVKQLAGIVGGAN
ncbi:MAG: response regulator [Chloroflexi bacterium]|nr:response regulator [Chloroflexota bacterium]